MATLTVTIVSAQGTSAKTLTFSGTDATRILAAYQTVSPGGTQDSMAADFGSFLRDTINTWVTRKEAVYPTPPTMT